MNLNHTVKVVGSVLLSAVMAGSMMPVTVFAQSNDENPTEKTETVYSVLNSDGSISDTIVSSWLHDEDGINNIKETLNLKDVKNIKSNEKPSKDGNTYTWNAKGNDVYYEGTATKQLPVSVKIRYELDGQEISANDIQGKSGHLKLTISFTNNYSEVKNINGKSIVIHPSYLAGGMLNMSTGKFSNVKCESGKIVNDGTNEMLAFANIPGLNETLSSAGLDKVNNQLGISDDVTVEADVNDFDLGSIMVGMTNEIDLASELGEIGSVSELTDGIDQLIEADNQLIDGSKQLYDGTTQLKEQAAPLVGSSDQVRQLSAGAIQLNDGVKALQTGISQYTAGASAINEGINQLYAIPQGAAQISEGITTYKTQSLVSGIDDLSAGLDTFRQQVNAGLSSADTKAMMEQLEQAEGVLNKMSGTLDKDEKIVSGLNQGMKDAKVLETLKTLKNVKETQLPKLQEAINNQIKTNNNAYTNNKKVVEGFNEDFNSTKKSMLDSIDATITALEAAKGTTSTSTTSVTDEEGNTTSSETSTTTVNNDAIDAQIAKLQEQRKQVEALTTTSHGELQEFVDMSQTLDQLGTLLDGVLVGANSLTGTVESAAENIGILQSDVSDSLDKISVLKSTLKKTDLSSLKTMGKTINDAIDELQKGTSSLRAGAKLVASSVDSLQVQSKAGIDKIKAGTTQLTSNNATLNGGASALSQATGTLAGQSGTFNEMADGLDTLGEAFETLNDGAKQLYEGNEQFKSEGLDQLKEKVDLGVGELETLQDVMNEIKAMNKEYASYSGAPEGATVTSRYVFRTKEESSK
jgi:putative membrane protein